MTTNKPNVWEVSLGISVGGGEVAALGLEHFTFSDF